MRRHAIIVVFALCLSVLAVASLTGCSTSGTSTGSYGSQRSLSGTTGVSGSATTGYASAGERIYLTGVGSDGRAISRAAPPVSQGALMMGGGGCASCHAANGRGGTIRMMMGPAIEAPDITYDALIKAGFTDTTVGKAIRDGLDESGKPLNEAMPRWQMDDADLAATIAYLKELSAR